MVFYSIEFPEISLCVTEVLIVSTEKIRILIKESKSWTVTLRKSWAQRDSA
jgi:hypothetical protein